MKATRHDPASWIAELREGGWTDAADTFAALLADAERWRALMNSGRIRIMGSGGMKDGDDPRVAHVGLELWAWFPPDTDIAAINVYGQQRLTKYVDEVQRVQRDFKNVGASG